MSLADEVAALRPLIEELQDTLGRPSVAAAVSDALDRIAAGLPQRALFGEREVSQHACGAVKYGEGMPGACSWCHDVGPWVPLYTLPGAEVTW